MLNPSVLKIVEPFSLIFNGALPISDVKFAFFDLLFLHPSAKSIINGKD